MSSRSRLSIRDRSRLRRAQAQLSHSPTPTAVAPEFVALHLLPAPAQRYAVLLSLLMTAGQNAVDPEQWLCNTLLALDYTPNSALDSLLPLAGWAPPTPGPAATG